MSDAEGSPLEQPDSPEEQEDLTTETNGDQPEESENEDQEAGSRKRSLSTSEDKNDDSPSIKVSKEEISLAIICDTHAKALEKIKQTETSVVFHLKVKITEDLSLATIPGVVEDVLSEDPETKCVVILIPQDDLRHESIPHSCKMNNCSGQGLQHILPLPVSSLPTYMDTLKRTREELVKTYPDTDFYWVTPGPVDFRHLNRLKRDKRHGHSTTSQSRGMWEVIMANYNKRLKVINEEIPGNMTINWFTRSCFQNRDSKGKKSDNSIQRVLQGDFTPVKTLGLIDEGENLSVKGGQAMWVIIRKKIKWYRKMKAMERAKEETEKEDDTEDDHKKEDEVNGKDEEDADTQDDVTESQKKKLDEPTVIKTTIIGESWIQILSDIERWQPDPENRMNVKVYPDLTLDSVINKVDEVLSEDTDTKHLVLSVFQNDISIGLSEEYVENECLPCIYSTVEDLIEKASNIGKYIKKTYPQVKLFWATPGPVSYYSEDNEKEEKMEFDSNEKEKEGEKKEEETEEKEDKAEDEEKEENNEEKEENNEEKEGKKEEKDETNQEKNKEEADEEEEEEKEEDPEIRKLRKACSRCNAMAMILSKRLRFRFKKQVIDWFEMFYSKIHNDKLTGPKINYNPEYERQILEGKVAKHGNLDDDLVNLSELGGYRLMKLILTTISGEKPPVRVSNESVSPGINKKVGVMAGRMDRGRGRGNFRGRGIGRGRGGNMKDSVMGRKQWPIDNRLPWDGRGGGQADPWGQQGGGNWKGQQRRFQNHDMRDIINRERAVSNQRDYWGRSNQFVDPWARNNYSGYYGQRY